MRLEVRLLGDVAATVDEHALNLGGARQRSVFALLALQRDRVISTEQLADHLWPDEQPLTAIKTIQVYVSRIRRLLGPAGSRLASSGTGYRLSLVDDELDVARFERGLRRSREAFASGSSHDAQVALEDALANWSGPALGDLAGERFARREADRLEELRLQALEELSELRIAAGLGRSTIGELRRLVADEPGRERLWRLLMQALYADGRQSEALQAYQDARAYLTDELGLDPSPELQDLERAILTQEAPRPEPVARFPTRADLATTSNPHAGAATTASDPTIIREASVGRRSRRTVTVLRARVVRPAVDDELDPEVLDVRNARAEAIVRRAVERHGGSIDRFDHDGMTAVFGLTVAREDDASRAVRAAVESRDDSAALDDAIHGPALAVGVATGEALTHAIDEHGSRVTGAPVTVAIRLANRAGPSEILISADTERLIGEAASSEPSQVPDGEDAHGAAAVRLVALADIEAVVRGHSAPFVGRAAELDAVLAGFEHVVSQGAPGLVTVMGVPGVGKSRLVAEVLARIADRATILRSRCLPYGEGITYWPIRELVLGSLGIGPGERGVDALARMDRIVGELDRGDRVRAGLASIVGLADASVAGEEIAWAVRRYVEALAVPAPLVAVVDDLQWAEPVLIELLEHVLDLGRGPILLITIARQDLEEARPDWLARTSLGLVRLDALSGADAATLLDHLAPDLPPGPLRTRILATSEGNPLFVEQFVAYTADQEVVAGGRLDERTAPDLPIPPTIGALLAARLDRMPEAERRVLERAAVIGRTFGVGPLAELLPETDRHELPRRLARLVRRDLIRRDRSDPTDDEAYRFRHLLIRDASYATLPKRERSELHAQFADWLEGHAIDQPGDIDLIVGYHLEQAYRYRTELGDERVDTPQLAARAVDRLAPAGLAAQDRGDAHAAVSLLRRAMDLAPSGRRRTELAIALRAALRTAGRREESDGVDAEVAAWLADHPDPGLDHRRRLDDAQFGDPYSPAEAKAAYAYYEQADDPLGMIRALHAGSNAHAGAGRFTLAIELLEHAVALARQIGQADRAATLFGRSAFTFVYGPIPVPDALARLRDQLELSGDNRQSRALIHMALGQLEARNGVREDWRRHFDAAREIIDDLGLLIPMGAFGYPMFLGDTELTIGEPERVADFLKDSCASLDRLGDFVGGLASLVPLTARVLLEAGRLDEVEHYAYWGRDIAEPDDVDAQAEWRIAMAGLRSRQGRHEEAITLARQAVDLFEGLEMAHLLAEAQLTLAGALRAAEDEPGAVVAAQAARRIAAAKEDQAASGRIDAFLAGRHPADRRDDTAPVGERPTRCHRSGKVAPPTARATTRRRGSGNPPASRA